nr:immunoglobulin heavy chain junction region [Macaca mulatta]MOX58742.1 immunoglobulin heavy chain junction region [Macaca mulatta]MOX58843.1 immunoglobulin heavy chain junction region [Macaca mulatta]MOX58861.1 immunoglobulin heavy chain junction region [Macaca mulatta]MOX58997.1 immunoglobulin heavy chain junction region [Macaca mulatta]
CARARGVIITYFDSW